MLRLIVSAVIVIYLVKWILVAPGSFKEVQEAIHKLQDKWWWPPLW